MNCRKNYSYFLQKNPCKIFLSFILINLGIAFFLVNFNYLGFTEGGSYDWVISDSKISKNNDALSLAYSESDNLNVVEKISERSRQSQTHTISYIFEWKDNRNKDIFNSKNLKTMCEVERFFIKNKDYKDFCYLKNNKCVKVFTSLTNLFYPLNHTWECLNLGDNYIRNKKELIYNNIKSNDNSIYGFFVDNNFDKNKYTKKTRSNINLGIPLNGFNSSKDRPAQQREKYINFFKNIENNYFDFFNVKNTLFRSGYLDNMIKDDLRVRYYSWNLNTIEFQRVVNGDMLWTLCSILFVSFWIFIHTGSLFVTIFSMLQIILSMSFSFLIYRLVFGITYFTQLHGCAIFLALGIGADDIFVFTDAWKQSKNINDKLERLDITMKRTLLAVFNTSFTTTVAFSATAISPAMPISSFGIYAALTIITNYLFVILFTPTVVLIKESYINKICNCKKGDLVLDLENESNNEENLSNLGLTYKFFKNVYYPSLNFSYNKIKILPVTLLILLTSYGIFSTIEASKLSPPLEQEKWFNEKHMYTGFVDSMTNDFKSSDINDYTEITIAWGIKGIDRKKFNKWEPNDYRGEVIFYDNTDLISSEAMNHVEKTCDFIENWKCQHEGCSSFKNKLVIPNTTICFIRDFYKLYNKKNSNNFTKDLLNFRSNTIPLNNNLKNWKNYIGFVNNKLKFVSISFKSSMKTLVPMKVKAPIYNNVEEMMIEINKNSPNSIREAFQDGGIAWIWYDIERNLINSMFTGLAICFPISFLVLLFATMNWIISLLSIISIGFVVSCVLGFCNFFMGWQLGIAETVSAVIVIGFSIDYTVHIGHMYQEADELGFKLREERVLYSLERMGSTVLAGAVTTAGSALFMLGCQMTFFYKMSILISITIFFSLLYSLGFLISASILFGPQNENGKINLLKKNNNLVIEDNENPVIIESPKRRKVL